MKNAGYIVFVLFLFSCGSGGNSGQGKESGISALPVLDMEYAYEHVDEADTSFVWNDLIENERFIPLETKEECLIGAGAWTATLIGKDCLVSKIWGNREAVFLFDSCGRFVKQIVRRGRGPGEITGVLMNVIPFQNDRYVMFGTDYKTVITDRNGNGARDLNSDGQYRIMYPHDSGFVYVNQYQRFPNDSTFLCFTDSLGNVVKELKEPGEERVISEQPGTPLTGLDLRNIHFTDEKLWLMKSYNDTLFRITEERTVEPCLVLYRGKYSPVLNKKDRKTIPVWSYKEIGPYSVVISSVFQIWNRETGKLVAMRRFNTGDNIKYRLSDDRIVRMNLMSIKDGKFVFIINPLGTWIREYLNLKEDDNPVLMVADLKQSD